MKITNVEINNFRGITLDDILSVLDWIRKMPDFKLYREELFFELMRAIKFAKARNASILDAAQQIRMIPNNQNRYSNFRRLSSRTVLSKGLEFECVIIDLSDRYTVTEMYVAMTRAMKKIIFLSNNKKVCLCAPQL